MERALGTCAVPTKNKYLLLQSIVVTNTLSAKLGARKRRGLELGESGLQMTLLSHNTGLINSVFEGPTGQAVTAEQ